MNWTEHRRYQASWGTWYVQIAFADGLQCELSFGDAPDESEIDEIAQRIWIDAQEARATIEVVAEDGTVL